MTIKIELSESDLKRLIVEHLESQLGSVKLQQEFVIIETKSKQNYKSEWESAAFRARYEVAL